MTWLAFIFGWLIGALTMWVYLNITKKENNKTNWGE